MSVFMGDRPSRGHLTWGRPGEFTDSQSRGGKASRRQAAHKASGPLSERARKSGLMPLHAALDHSKQVPERRKKSDKARRNFDLNGKMTARHIRIVESAREKRRGLP